MVKELGVPVFVIAGNHDSNERIEYAADLLADSRLYIEGTMKDPIAETVAGPEPEIAAKNMHAKTVTIAKPPVIKTKITT